MRRATGIIVICLLSAVIFGMTLWASLAIYYSNLPGPHLRSIAAGLFALATPGCFLLLPKRRRTLLCFLAVFTVVVGWWMMIPASNDRDWQDDVAVLPYASIRNDLVTIHNIRNLNYRTETEYDLRYYDKTFDLKGLDALDLIAVYWMGDAIAHIMVSFGFEGKDYVVFSIETRKEKGEGYSTLKGFFKQYELIYIVGDERDLIRVRTEYRNPQEQVYLYRTKISREKARRLFMEYVQQINAMKEKPIWYNTLTTNCSTNIVRHARTFSDRIRYNWKILLSGYAPLYAYELGALDRRLPFTQLKEQSYVNAKAHLIGNDPEFSRKIRE